MLNEPRAFQVASLFQYIASHVRKWSARIGNVSYGITTSVHQWALTRMKLKIRSKYPTAQRPITNPQEASSPEEPLVVFLLGPPGAGKGTQSTLLKAAFPGPPLLTHLSYGELIRHIDKIPGSWVSSFPRRKGGSSNPLLPADAAVKLLRETIVETGIRYHNQRVWLVDGFPRDEKHVAAWTAAEMPPASCAIYLSCPPETLIRRVLSRGGTSSGRPDDAIPELVRERVERNNRESEALLVALAGAGVRVIRVDADRDVEVVRREVQAHFQVSLLYPGLLD